MKKIENIMKPFLKEEVPDIRPGDTVKVYQKIPAPPAKKGAKEKTKEKIQVFEGVVIARKHGQEPGATITVRKVVDGVGVERIFPLHLPTLEKIEVTKRSKVRRAKLYYLRKAKGKRARLKRKEFVQAVTPNVVKPKKDEEEKPEIKVEEEPTETLEEKIKEASEEIQAE